jgi:antirestriction protein
MEIRIYVANLAAYNAGRLVGEWIDLPLSEDELREKIQSILDAWNDGFSPSEEYAIHDYEAPFSIDEYDSPYKVNEWAERLSNISEDEEVINAIINHFSTVEEAIETIENGEYRIYNDCNDMADVAYAWYEETGRLAEIEKVISPSYIDWDAIGRDLEIEGTFIYAGNSVYVEITD